MATAKIKVLYLITKSNWGGAQRYVHDLAVGLPKDEFEAVVALGGDGPLAVKLKAAGVRVISIPSLQRDISIATELKAFSEISRIVKQERPDALHVNSSKAGVFGALLGRLQKVPNIIFTAHGWAFNEDRSWWQWAILKFIHWLTVLLSHRTIAVSREVKDQMDWPFVDKKIVTIHNGRSLTNLLDHGAAREALIEKEPRLREFQNDFWSMTIAELHPIKRHDAVIDVIKEMRVQEPTTRHIIIGEGDDRAKLEAEIKKLELSDNVFLLGRIDEAAKYLKAADIFVLASRSEGLPYVLIEALIAGLSTVTTAVGGIPEVIEDEVSGLLTPPLDNKALFKAILRVRQDPALRARLEVGAKARAGEFSLEKTLEKTLSLYRSES